MKNILANSPTASPDFNRSTQHKLFSGFQSPASVNNSISQHQNSQQQQQFFHAQNPNASISGPPTAGLFDYLKNEKSFQTPTKNFLTHQQSQSFSNGHQPQSFHNQSGFNQSRIMSPISNLPTNSESFNNNSYQNPQNSTFQTTVPLNNMNNSGYNNNFWITVFGFSSSAVSAILSHFSQCGSILEKICSSGNWMHLRFSSRLECDKALLYNGKIICNNLMIGVMRCTDETILDKENDGLQQQRDVTGNRIRSLTQSAYKSAQQPTEVVLSPNAPKRTTSIINKTLDMFFGW